MGMKKQDRITKLVDQCVDADICVWTNAERLAMVTLLRREQQRVRRIVQIRLNRCIAKHAKNRGGNRRFCEGYQLACHDLLAALKGKP